MSLLEYEEAGPNTRVAKAGQFKVLVSNPVGVHWWVAMELRHPDFQLTGGGYWTEELRHPDFQLTGGGYWTEDQAKESVEEDLPEWLRLMVLASREIEERGLPGGAMTYQGSFGELFLSIPTEGRDNYRLSVTYAGNTGREYAWAASAGFLKERATTRKGARTILRWLSGEAIRALESLGLHPPKTALERVCGDSWVV